MEKLKILLKYTPDGTPIAFFPELPAKFGHIVSYMKLGQHGESSFAFSTQCKPSKGNEPDIKELYRELVNRYDDCSLTITKRIQHSDLTNKAWKTQGV